VYTGVPSDVVHGCILSWDSDATFYDRLQVMDMVEGHDTANPTELGSLYQRCVTKAVPAAHGERGVAIETDGGEQQATPAYVYFQSAPPASLHHLNSLRIPGGDWLAMLAERAACSASI
jgi:hypothetical protein